MSNHILKPLIYADIDLNIIDGSAIWVTSILETMAQDPQIKPTILLKRPIIRDVLVRSFQNYQNITIINPWSSEFKKLGLKFEDDTWKKSKRLTTAQAADIMDKLDQKTRYSLFLVRGYNLAKEIAFNYLFSKRTWYYLTDFPQDRKRVSDEDLFNIRTIYENGARLALQTPHLIHYFKELLEIEDDGKFVYLPPMVPNSEAKEISFGNRNNQMIYSGKFAPFWKAPEMFETFARLENSAITFLVIGDKFHNYPYTDNYQQRVTDVLENTKNLIWKKGLSRTEVQEFIKKSDLGISWRHEVLDSSKELSTKVLEFGLYGKPVIINKNPLHIELFGEDYPLYANSEAEFNEKVYLAFSNPSIYEIAAKKVFSVSEKHMFKNVIKYLKPFLMEMQEIPQEIEDSGIRKFDKKKILFAGHDLKFAKMLIDYFKLSTEFQVKEDQWKGHNSHNEKQSKELLEWADIIIAEWGLGNAVWYSKNKKNHQVLIVRMHLQEKETQYPQKIVWDNVDQLIFIAPGLKMEMEETFDFLPKDKIKILYNLVDAKSLDKEKLDDSEFNIGLMGISPSRKRIDLALDIFEEMWTNDSRYTLFIKGHLPNKYAWLWNRKEEREYFEKVFRRINSSVWRDSVVFEGWGEVSEWYRKLRFILSPSDFESFHLAVAEGMASGCFPLIRNWHGAKELYPNDYIFSDVSEATDIIKKIQLESRKNINEKQQALKSIILTKYDKDVICEKWKEMLISHYQKKNMDKS
ncbi:glycosyltransferase [Bacillus sp. UMB0893]|uniref:glycosyltransferase n=1 Tax=Bacillus sp. UMB0893 TaxID=2066053 RepID=UPI000C761AD9|nr:glycosyltransferase [Bacillus sp. UMB0893]PLR67958.1 glycosyl transferase [Bacillus sp. UMB0893]